MDLMISSYLKYVINIHNKIEVLFIQWTFYERNYITLGELYLTLEALNPEIVKFEVPSYMNDELEADHRPAIEKKEIIEMIEKRFLDGNQ